MKSYKLEYEFENKHVIFMYSGEEKMAFSCLYFLLNSEFLLDGLTVIELTVPDNAEENIHYNMYHIEQNVKGVFSMNKDYSNLYKSIICMSMVKGKKDKLFIEKYEIHDFGVSKCVQVNCENEVSNLLCTDVPNCLLNYGLEKIEKISQNKQYSL